MSRESIVLAEKIVELDLLRDQLLEQLMDMAGNEAFELLRSIQNR
ncbi:hypothetical protein MUG87_00935 [Ectobacillus sp. JY-23]|nr:hypothetical protein [Ectobacillus sp. JY-23]UOY92746.1 hypothetical protein MUG87_00935 [Ectobacillus sp. JY-23]